MAAPAPIAAQMGMIQPPFGPGRWCPPAQLANWVVLSPVDQATYITNYNRVTEVERLLALQGLVILHLPGRQRAQQISPAAWQPAYAAWQALGRMGSSNLRSWTSSYQHSKLDMYSLLQPIQWALVHNWGDPQYAVQQAPFLQPNIPAPPIPILPAPLPNLLPAPPPALLPAPFPAPQAPIFAAGLFGIPAPIPAAAMPPAPAAPVLGPVVVPAPVLNNLQPPFGPANWCPPGQVLAWNYSTPEQLNRYTRNYTWVMALETDLQAQNAQVIQQPGAQRALKIPDNIWGLCYNNYLAQGNPPSADLKSWKDGFSDRRKQLKEMLPRWTFVAHWLDHQFTGHRAQYWALYHQLLAGAALAAVAPALPPPPPQFMAPPQPMAHPQIMAPPQAMAPPAPPAPPQIMAPHQTMVPPPQQNVPSAPIPDAVAPAQAHNEEPRQRADSPSNWNSIFDFGTDSEMEDDDEWDDRSYYDEETIAEQGGEYGDYEMDEDLPLAPPQQDPALEMSPEPASPIPSLSPLPDLEPVSDNGMQEEGEENWEDDGQEDGEEDRGRDGEEDGEAWGEDVRMADDLDAAPPQRRIRRRRHGIALLAMPVNSLRNERTGNEYPNPNRQSAGPYAPYYTQQEEEWKEWEG